jgi:hypothetical protein
VDGLIERRLGTIMYATYTHDERRKRTVAVGIGSRTAAIEASGSESAASAASAEAAAW